MSDDLIALFLALALFFLMAVWVPFLAFLQFIAHRESNRAKDSAQIRREDSVGCLERQGLVKDEFSIREVHPGEFPSTGRIVVDDRASLSSVPHFEPKKLATDRGSNNY